MVGSPSRTRKTLILNHEWMELVSLDRQSIYEKENSDNKPTALQVWELGTGLTTQSQKKTPVTETTVTNPENNLAPEESSPVEPIMWAGESHWEASAQTTLQTAKSKTRIGTWNI